MIYHSLNNYNLHIISSNNHQIRLEFNISICDGKIKKNIFLIDVKAFKAMELCRENIVIDFCIKNIDDVTDEDIFNLFENNIMQLDILKQSISSYKFFILHCQQNCNIYCACKNIKY